eukprot:gene8387-9962_t
MSLVVIYEGQRKIVKIPSPNTLVQALLLDCATQFKVDVAKVAFRHKRTILDNAQPIRFCNLSNNAQVDLIVVSGSGSAKNQSCKIALAIDGGENTTETFDASISLYEMLSLLATQSKIPADIHQRSPEVVYLRAKYEGFEALTATTFTSLGLAGQSARLQLRFSAGAATPVPISVPIVPVDEPISATKEDTATELLVAKEVICVPKPAPAATSPAKPVSPVVPVALTKNTASTLPAPHTAPAPTIDNNDPVAVISSILSAPPALPSLPSPAATVSAILSDNFDRVSVPAVLTLARYLLNILLNPLEDNVGFVYPPYNNAVLVLLPADSPVASSESGENSSVLGAAQLALLQDGYAQLLRAMKELEVPVEERPYQGADWATVQKQAQQRESEQRSASQLAAYIKCPGDVTGKSGMDIIVEEISTTKAEINKAKVELHSAETSNNSVDAHRFKADIARKELLLIRQYQEKHLLAGATESVHQYFRVRATVENSIQFTAWRAKIYCCASECEGFYDGETKDTIFYAGNDLSLRILFETRSSARRFVNLLERRAQQFNLLSKLSVEGTYDVVQLAQPASEIHATHYRHLESNSPPHSLAASDYPLPPTEEVELTLCDAGSAYNRLQMVENPDSPVLKGIGFYRCHLEAQAANKDTSKNHNNILMLSWVTHQRFDGLNLVTKQHMVPSIAIRFERFAGSEQMEFTDGSSFSKDKVVVAIESPDAVTLQGLGYLLKQGSEQKDGEWLSFVHVDSWKEFKEFLDIKYDETKTMWEKGLTAATPLPGRELNSIGKRRRASAGQARLADAVSADAGPTPTTRSTAGAAPRNANGRHAAQTVPAVPSAAAVPDSKKAKKEGKAKDTDKPKPAPAAAAATEDTSSALDPTKLEIRCGVVLKCWNHPDSEKLLCEEIDMGNGDVRQIASDIRAFYAAEQLVGMKVVVLCNLKERSIGGFKNQGMVLCAVSADHSVIRLLEAPASAAAGDRVTFPPFPADSVAATAAQMVKKKILEGLAPGLRTDCAGVAHWNDSPFTIGTGVCAAPGVVDAVVS